MLLVAIKSGWQQGWIGNLECEKRQLARLVGLRLSAMHHLRNTLCIAGDMRSILPFTGRCFGGLDKVASRRNRR